MLGLEEWRTKRLKSKKAFTTELAFYFGLGATIF
jgi:hypothetical protein